MAALTKGAVSEPLTLSPVSIHSFMPRNVVLTHGQSFICNENTSQIAVAVERVKDGLESGKLGLVPVWQRLSGSKV